MKITSLINHLEQLRAQVGDVTIHALSKDGDIEAVKSIQDMFTMRGSKQWSRHTISTEVES